MTLRLIALVAAMTLAAMAQAQEFHIVASRRAVVRELPELDARAIVRLERGDTAACFTNAESGQPEQQNRFYHIRLDDGRTGWVSTFTVRAHDGAAARPAPAVHESPIEAHAAATHLALGAPRGAVQLTNEGYVVGYDPRLRIPAWTQYRLTSEDLAIDRARSDDFREDARTAAPGRATLIDYEVGASWDLWEDLGLAPAPPANQPNYARGHLTPARDMARTDEIERSSYLLSNMAPQVHRAYNSGTWSALELRVRQWAQARGALTIITGPVFLSSPRVLTPAIDEGDRLDVAGAQVVLGQPPTERQVIYNVVGPGEIAVPTAFFKIVVDHQDSERIEALAFLVPHYGKTGRDLADLLVSVDEIERLTGLDVLPALPDEVEDRVERDVASRLW